MDFNREIIRPRIFALLGFILIAGLLVVALRAEGATPRPPLEATVVRECGHIRYVLFVLADGTVEKVTPSEDNADAIVSLLNVTARYHVLDMDCAAVGHDSVR